MDRPDVQGRIAILQVHSRGKVLSKDVDLDKIARRTPGFTGRFWLYYVHFLCSVLKICFKLGSSLPECCLCSL